MTPTIPTLPPALVQAADTVVMLQARDGLGTAAAVADVAMAIAFVLILLGLGLVLIQLRGIKKTVTDTLGRLERKADPLIDRGREIAANVEFITGAVRTDVQRVSDSVQGLSDRLEHASELMEERVGEFNALMEVVQGEAEDLFIGTAATVRGVREGTRALGHRGDDDADRPLGSLPAPAAGEPDDEETAPDAAPGGVQVTGPGRPLPAGRRPGGP